MSHSEYLKEVFNPGVLHYTVVACAKKLEEIRKQGIDFQAIAFGGNSGAGIAYPLSFYTGIPLICVRKNRGKGSHGKIVESCNERVERYIIVDDLVCSGATIQRIIEGVNEMNSYGDELGHCVGILLYHCLPGARTKSYNGETIPVFYLREEN